MRKLLTHPISRIMLGLLACLFAFIFVQNIASKVLELLGTGRVSRNLFKGISASLAVIYTYSLFFKWLEKRKVTEISARNLPRNVGLGLMIGMVIQSFTIFVIYLNSGFHVIGINSVTSVIIPLTVAFTSAIFEEILIRGILFRILEERLGSYIALMISAIIFGALHFFNPAATFVSATCVALEAGLLLGTAYMYSRSLWLPISIHFAWNFVQSGIFGAITSGNEYTGSLLVTKITGPEFITGGNFGPEGSIQATIFCLIAAILLMHFNIKNNQLIPYAKFNERA
ncbi:CPBP family intramembrane metalloprotease [Inquilinus sp. KBS0705]|nr:CPBP family intramembrane metalloprotease [Inquilinus sp. KBS0705]